MKYAIVNMVRALRVNDNPMLEYCCSNGYIPIPIYYLDTEYLLGVDEDYLSTNIPRMMGTKYDWMKECILDCKLYLQEYGLDLCVLIGDITTQITLLLHTIGLNEGDEVICCSLAYPDQYEIRLNANLKSVCNSLNIKWKLFTGYSTYINICAIFSSVKELPYELWNFKQSCKTNLAKGNGLVSLSSYSITSWNNDIRIKLQSLIQKGVIQLDTMNVKHNKDIYVREDVLGIPNDIRLEEKVVDFVIQLLKHGGVISYDNKKLQSTTMLSPFVSMGVLAPYRLFNECLLMYGELVQRNANNLLLSKYVNLIENMLLNTFSVTIGNLEHNNLHTLNSSIYGRTVDLSNYLSIDKSKEMINNLSLDSENIIDSHHFMAVGMFIKALMNRGYVSYRVRLAIALWLNNCNIHPYVVRDLFRGFLIDYSQCATYNALLWCLGITNKKSQTPPFPLSITKQLIKREYGYVEDDYNITSDLKGRWNNNVNSINILSVPLLLESNRLPIRTI